MSKQPETIFKDKFRKELEAIPYSWWVKVSLPSLLGIPDMLGCVRGKFVAIELKKSEKEKPTEMQLYHLKTIADCGGYACVAYPQAADKILKDLWNISG